MEVRQIFTCGIALALNIQASAALIEIKSISDYDKQLHSGRPTVIKFFAPWCGACVANKPDFDALINDPTLAHIDFAIINFDDLADLANREKIESIPTFLYLHKGEKVATITGGQTAAIMRQDIQTRFPVEQPTLESEQTQQTTPELQKEPTAQPEVAQQPEQTQQVEQTGVWHNVKKGFNWVVDGIASAGSYIGKKIKNLFS